MMANVERNLMMRGVPKEEIEKSREKMYQDAAEPAERKVRATLILEAIADKEGVEVTEEELQEEIRKIAEQNQLDPGEMRRRMVENETLENMKHIMREDKTVEFLLGKAKVKGGSAAPAPKEGKDKK